MFTPARSQVHGRTCRYLDMASVPQLPRDRSGEVPPPGLLPEVRQSGLLLGFALTVVGLAFGAEHLLATLH